MRERGGRLFFLGVGGSAGNCSHAVNDFRKIAGIEAYAPADNVSELTARTNDEGWEHGVRRVAEGQPAAARRTCVFVFSVGGGSLEATSARIWCARSSTRSRSAPRIVGVVGRDGGYTAQVADACVIVPTVNPDTVTPHTEAFQAVVWHLLVSHPALKAAPTKWESTRSERRACRARCSSTATACSTGRSSATDDPYPPAAADRPDNLPGVARGARCA